MPEQKPTKRQPMSSMTIFWLIGYPDCTSIEKFPEERNTRRTLNLQTYPICSAIEVDRRQQRWWHLNDMFWRAFYFSTRTTHCHGIRTPSNFIFIIVFMCFDSGLSYGRWNASSASLPYWTCSFGVYKINCCFSCCGFDRSCNFAVRQSHWILNVK